MLNSRVCSLLENMVGFFYPRILSLWSSWDYVYIESSCSARDGSKHTSRIRIKKHAWAQKRPEYFIGIEIKFVLATVSLCFPWKFNPSEHNLEHIFWTKSLERSHKLICVFFCQFQHCGYHGLWRVKLRTKEHYGDIDDIITKKRKEFIHSKRKD